MIDVVGAIVLTAIAILSTGLLVLTAPVSRSAAARLCVLAGLWLALIVALGASGAFVIAGIGALGVAIVAPVVILAAIGARVAALRAVAFDTPLAVLVAVHAGRLLGGFFLALHAQGRLPSAFALGAGWGDIVVAALALPVAWVAARRAPFWRPVTLLWNAVAFVDLLTAVTLGVGSAPDFPLRFIGEDATQRTMAMLPWVLIPAFLVPLYLLAHLAVFARVRWEHAARPALAAR